MVISLLNIGNDGASLHGSLPPQPHPLRDPWESDKSLQYSLRLSHKVVSWLYGAVLGWNRGRDPRLRVRAYISPCLRAVGAELRSKCCSPSSTMVTSPMSEIFTKRELNQSTNKKKQNSLGWDVKHQTNKNPLGWDRLCYIYSICFFCEQIR